MIILGGVLKSYWLVRVPFHYFCFCLALYFPLLPLTWMGRLGWKLVVIVLFIGTTKKLQK